MKFWKDVNNLMKNKGYVSDEYGTYDCNKCGTQGVRYVQYIRSLGRPSYLPLPVEYKRGAKRWTLLGSEVVVVHCPTCKTTAVSDNDLEGEIMGLVEGA